MGPATGTRATKGPGSTCEAMSTKLSAVLASTALDRDSAYATILASSSATLATIEAPMANLMRRRRSPCCRVSGALLLAPAPPRARCSPPLPAATPLPSSGSCSQSRAGMWEGTLHWRRQARQVECSRV